MKIYYLILGSETLTGFDLNCVFIPTKMKSRRDFHHFTSSPFHYLPFIPSYPHTLYSTLIASTGFNFNAFLAGIIADKIPVQKIIIERWK